MSGVLASLRRCLRVLATAVAVVLLSTVEARIAQAEKKPIPEVQDMAERFKEIANAPRKIIFSIGIAKFDDHFWPALKFPTKDAQDVFNFFRSTAKPSFDYGRIYVGEHKGMVTGRVTSQDLRDAMRALKRLNRSEEDTVVLYISSHGTLDLTKDHKVGRFIVTSSTKEGHIADTAVEYEEIAEAFKDLKSKKKALILAFCNSGAGKSRVTARILEERRKRKGKAFDSLAESSEGMVILSASGVDEAANESDTLQNDVYTHFLIKGFAAAETDTSRDGATSITEAHDFARNATFDYTSGQQRPTLDAELVGQDPIIINGEIKKDGWAVVYSYDLRRPVDVLINGMKKGLLKKGMPIEPGKVKLTLIDPTTKRVILDRMVNFEPGMEYSVLDLLNPTSPSSLSMGARVFHLEDVAVREQYIPGTSLGAFLEYNYAEIYRDFDLSMQLTEYRQQSERIILNEDHAFDQQRTMVEGAVLMRQRVPLRWLSTSGRRVVTHFRWGLGPWALWVQREVQTQAFDRPVQSSVLPGVSTGMGLVSEFPLQSARLGGDVQATVLANRFDAGKQAIVTTSAHLFLGFSW